MTCSEFVARFSDVHDGNAQPEVVRRAEEHAASCASCARYREVVARGVELLRALPPPEVNQDLAPTLRRRLAHLDQEALVRRHTNSGASVLAVLGMAALLVAVAWAPALRRGAPVVELAPIVVQRPPAALHSRSLAAFSAFASLAKAPAFSRAAAQPAMKVELWGDARALLFQYSRLAQRYGQRTAMDRSGLGLE